VETNIEARCSDRAGRDRLEALTGGEGFERAANHESVARDRCDRGAALRDARLQASATAHVQTRPSHCRWDGTAEEPAQHEKERLEAIALELAREPVELKALYEVARRRLKPVGLVDLWPRDQTV